MGERRETSPLRNLASSVENARKSVSQFSQDKFPLAMIVNWNAIVMMPAIPAMGWGKKVKEWNQQLREVIP